MTSDTFAARRSAAWQELEARIARARGGGLRDLSAAEIERFGVLYRRAASDLAIARRDFPDDAVTEYLNALCARAHPLLHRGDPLRPAALPQFFGTWLPSTFRAARRYVLTSLALTLIGVLAGWLAVVLRPDIAATLVPDSLFDKMARGEVPTGTETLPGGAGFEASFIITNNIRVALIAFAGGVLCGLPTAAVLLTNGWALGTLAAAVHRRRADRPVGHLDRQRAGHPLAAVRLPVGRPGRQSVDRLLVGLHRRRHRAHGSDAASGVTHRPEVVMALPEALKDFSLEGKAALVIGGASGVLLYSWLMLSGRSPRLRGRLSLDRATAAAPVAN